MHIGKIMAAALAAAFSSAAVLAQVQVVEPTPALGSRGGYSNGGYNNSSAAVSYPSSTASVAVAPTSASQADLFYQLQSLREEVLELRGLVEEQSHEIKSLKQQRLDDYMNLDKRLSELSKGRVSASTLPSNTSSASPASPDVAADSALTETVSAPVSGEEPVRDEMQQYRAAIDAVLKQKDYQKAIVEFNRYLAAFPDGRYVPNCQYWLGEIYLLQGELEQSKKWFSALISEYPLHDKAPDAKYKLGMVYHKLGDKAKAQQLLSEVAASSAGVARLAQDYLSTNLK